MRKLFVTAALTAALLVGGAPQAWAAPPDPVPDDGWSVADGQLTWRSDRRIPMGDAAVEFYAGDRLLGRPRPTADERTFRLPLEHAKDLKNLQVRAGGRRLDAAAPPAARKRAAAPPLTAPQALPPTRTDPGVKGPYRTVSGEYSLAGVRLPGMKEPVEMQGVVIAPRGASGPRPLALFLHGRHYTCFGSGEEEITGDWPCTTGTRPVPSHRGYLQAQELLASQGYVTVSISANGINGQDGGLDDGGAQARSSLVRQHLARWADWSGAGRAGAPAVVRSAPRADLGKVFLMGHSRGGEGVSRAALDSLTPPPPAQDGYRGRVRWNIRGLLLIGPTIFGQNPVPDVPSATVLPGCDGDVLDLQGQIFVDATRGVSRGKALHSALYMVGANHNYFNTEWTPGQSVAPSFDDFYSGDETDPVCSPGTPTRLTAAQEQTAGATYIAAAARLFVGGDDRVRPLLDGSGVRAPSAGPARVLSHALGAGRTAAVIPDGSVKVTGGRLCEQVTDDPARVCLPTEQWWSPSPHFTPFVATREPGRYAVALSWTSPGKPVSVRPSRPVSLAGARDLALRLAVPPNTTGNRFGVAVTDTAGRRTDLGEVRLDGLPGSPNTTSYWGQEVRVPLRKVGGKVAKLELTPRNATGQAWLIDAWGWRPGTPAVQPVSLPRVDVGQLEVEEGDSGTRTYQVPVQVTGRGPGQVRLFLTDSATYETRSWLATVRPGTRRIRVPIEVAGDTLFGTGDAYLLDAKAVKGLVVGDYHGGVLVDDDDPAPKITVEPVTDRVAEGGTLSWRVRLSAVAESPIWIEATVQPPASGTELSSTDVDPTWFAEQTGEDPLPSRPLSETYLAPWIGMEPGELTAELTVPTVTDATDEPDELLRLRLAVVGWEEEGPELGTVTGTVTD